MKCESCNKKLATVHLTEIVEKEKKERHFCEDCAQNVTNHFPKAPSPSDILTSLINQVSPEIREMSKATCPVCGLSYLEFRMHGSSQHVGKVPANAGAEIVKKNELIQLRKELNEAVERENYEKAAELRDKIYELSGNVEDGD